MDDKNMDMLYAHISECGAEGLLPQNLSKPLFEIVSTQVSNLQLKNEEKPIEILIKIVLHLLEATNENNLFSLKEEDFLDKVDIYGLNINIEELRKNGFVEIKKSHLPTVENILDENRDLAVDGDLEIMEYFTKKHHIN